MSDHQVLLQIPVTSIRAGTNDRKVFNEEKLHDLALSIQADGLAEPIVVRSVNSHFELVAGERRLRAMSTVLGWDTIPCLVTELTDEKAASLMLAENTSRADLNPIEEAEAYQSRITLYGWSVEHLSEVAGVSKDRVKKRLMLLSLAPEFQQLVKFGGLPLGHAEAMCPLDHNRQITAKRIYEKAKTPMVAAQFKVICDDLLNEQNQDNLTHLELTISEQVKQGAGAWVGGRDAIVHVPTRDDMPPVVSQRTKGMTASMAIEDYIKVLEQAGMTTEAATIGTLFTGLVKASLMKPRIRVQACQSAV